MPWSHCGQDRLVDTDPCPDCGITKTQWTVEFEVTREFTIRRRQTLRITLLDEPGEAPVAGESYRVEDSEGELVGEGELDDEGQARVACPSQGDYVLRFANQTHATMRIETRTGKVRQGEDAAAYTLASGKAYAFRLGQLPWLVTVDPEDDEEEHLESLRLEAIEGSYAEWAYRNHALTVDGHLEFRFPAGEPGYFQLTSELVEDEYQLIRGLVMPSQELPEVDEEEEPPTFEEVEVEPSHHLGSEDPLDLDWVCGPEEDPDPTDVVRFLEIQGNAFQPDSAVLLPERLTPLGEQVDGSASGLLAVESLLRFVQRFPENVLAVAGHSDADDTEDGAELSRLRAENVLAYLRGEKEAWVSSALDHHKLEDVQQVLKFVGRLRAWPCDPGAVDGEVGERFQGALGRFRARIAEVPDDEPPEGDDDLTQDEWGLVYDCYEEHLADLLDSSPEALAELRGRLSFLDPAAAGCGVGTAAGFWASHVEGEVEDTSASSDSGSTSASASDGDEEQDGSEGDEGEANPVTDRRVDLLLFDPAQAPALAGDEGDSALLYDATRFNPEAIPVQPTDVFLIKLKNEDGQPIPEAEFVARLEGDEIEEVHGRLGRGGIARLLRPVGERIRVSYPDPDDVLAKSEAGHALLALQAQDLNALGKTLRYGPDLTELLVAAYDTYFNEISGDGLIADIEAAFADEDLIMADGLMAMAGLSPSSGTSWVPDEDDEAGGDGDDQGEAA